MFVETAFRNTYEPILDHQRRRRLNSVASSTKGASGFRKGDTVIRMLGKQDFPGSERAIIGYLPSTEATAHILYRARQPFNGHLGSISWEQDFTYFLNSLTLKTVDLIQRGILTGENGHLTFESLTRDEDKKEQQLYLAAGSYLQPSQWDGLRKFFQSGAKRVLHE